MLEIIILVGVWYLLFRVIKYAIDMHDLLKELKKWRDEHADH